MHCAPVPAARWPRAWGSSRGSCFGRARRASVWRRCCGPQSRRSSRSSSPARSTSRISACARCGTRSAAAPRTRRAPERRARRAASAVSLRQGLISDLGNPKIAIFFTTFLPQFVSGHHASFVPLMTLGLIFCALTLAWLAGYSVLAARAGDLLRRGPLRRGLDGATGSCSSRSACGSRSSRARSRSVRRWLPARVDTNPDALDPQPSLPTPRAAPVVRRAGWSDRRSATAPPEPTARRE